MTHDELLHEIDLHQNGQYSNAQDVTAWDALREVVELHQPKHFILKDTEITEMWCDCGNGRLTPYPCRTIQKILGELK